MKRKQRRQINRTGIFECEVCKEPNILQQHHIRGRDIPNANKPYNLANICSNCHNKVHHGLIIIEDRIMTTNGLELIWHYPEEESLTGNDAKPHLI